MPNRLQYESSPYLLQHALNPVDWYPWGTEAFDKARERNLPVLVSIGYAACHWCHVMEKESFENETVAEFMNQHFVCIKVDREEHPDVDHLYMDALQAMSGSGGWPLNMFVTPEKEPFYGGTYFPPVSMYGRTSWLELLEAIRLSWSQKPDEVALQARQMVLHLQQIAIPGLNGSESPLQQDDLHVMAGQLLRQADKLQGGFGAAPKFPGTMSLQFLLRYAHAYKQQDAGSTAQALEHVRLSLNKMIAGGIYDQVGGGFARYATDPEWLVPHFEKMLYDNALLLQLLCEAYLVTKEETYKEVIAATVAFCNLELRSTEHPGYFSALDADSEGVEGKYYTWTTEELAAVLPDMHPALIAWWGISPEGNWEHTNILNRAVPIEELLATFQLSGEAFATLLKDAATRLRTARALRVRPGTDDKVLLSWNALFNTALQKAAVVLEQPELLEQAVHHMGWLLATFYSEEQKLQHVWCKGALRIPAKLDDYAYLIHALLQLSTATGDLTYINRATELTEYVQQHFLHEDHNFFYFSADMQTDIIVRKTEIYDGATPAANAVMQQNLYWLGSLMERSDWIEQAAAMLQSMQQTVLRYPTSFGYWASLLLESMAPYQQLIIAGPSAKTRAAKWRQQYEPFILMLPLSGAADEVPALAHKYLPDKDLYYLCRQFECQAPVTDLSAVMSQIEGENA